MWTKIVYFTLIFSCIMIIAGVLLTFFTVTTSIETNRKAIIVNRNKLDSLLNNDNITMISSKDTSILIVVKKNNQLLIKINDKLK